MIGNVLNHHHFPASASSVPTGLGGVLAGYLADFPSTPRAIRPGVDFVREGEGIDQVHILVDGWAYRYKTKRDGLRQVVAVLLPGDCANLDAFAFSRSDYGVRALTPVKVATVRRDRLEELAERHVEVARAFARAAMAENAVLSQWALRLGRQSAAQRLTHLLCELSTRLGADGPAARFDLPMTQELLADTLGLTAVHVNRTMQQLRAEGLIATAGRTVTIPDQAELRRVAEFDPAYLHRETDADASDRARRSIPAM